MEQPWRVIDTGCQSGYYNMAMDEAIMNQIREDNAPPTLRFYQWCPATLTIGYFQDLAKEIDMEVCNQLGIQVVRRLTGGRAVLHQGELTYSLICSQAHQLAQGSILDTYLRISKGLVNGLERLGINASMESQPHKVRDGSSAACFDAPSWYELVVNGKKLVGSAQTRRDGIMLQHGSIPMEQNLETLVKVLRFSTPGKREKLLGHLAHRATAINDHISGQLSMNKLAMALTEGLAEELGAVMLPEKPTAKEEKLTTELLSKYSSDQWNYHRGRKS